MNIGFLLVLLHNMSSASAITQYVKDIFGWRDADGTYHEGLVDSDSIDGFNTALLDLKNKWNQIEQDDFQDKTHKVGFHDWFTKFKADDFRSSTLRPLRERIGLGSPPSSFHTNDSESINVLLKESLGYKNTSGPCSMKRLKKLLSSSSMTWLKLSLAMGSTNFALNIHFWLCQRINGSRCPNSSVYTGLISLMPAKFKNVPKVVYLI